jgi:hypothetical protein
MGFLDKLEFKVWDSTGAIVTLLDKWKPRGCSTERDFEKSLYDLLHSELGDIQVTKQYARGRIRADLVIGDKVIVELKHNLNSTAKYQRLVGQLAEYKEWDGQIVLLLTGKTDQNLRKQLDSYLKKEGLTEGILEDKVTVYQK